MKNRKFIVRMLILSICLIGSGLGIYTLMGMNPRVQMYAQKNKTLYFYEDNYEIYDKNAYIFTRDKYYETHFETYIDEYKCSVYDCESLVANKNNALVYEKDKLYYYNFNRREKKLLSVKYDNFFAKIYDTNKILLGQYVEAYGDYIYALYDADKDSFLVDFSVEYDEIFYNSFNDTIVIGKKNKNESNQECLELFRYDLETKELEFLNSVPYTDKSNIIFHQISNSFIVEVYNYGLNNKAYFLDESYNIISSSELSMTYIIQPDMLIINTHKNTRVSKFDSKGNELWVSEKYDEIIAISADVFAAVKDGIVKIMNYQNVELNIIDTISTEFDYHYSDSFMSDERFIININYFKNDDCTKYQYSYNLETNESTKEIYPYC